jgi:hypothetical protein
MSLIFVSLIFNLLLLCCIIGMLYYYYKQQEKDKSNVNNVKVSTTQPLLLLKGNEHKIDGVVINDYDLVLVKDQKRSSENGIYKVSKNKWILVNKPTRTGDMIYVQEGNKNGGKIFIQQVFDNDVIYINFNESILGVNSNKDDYVMVSDSNSVRGFSWYPRSKFIYSKPKIVDGEIHRFSLLKQEKKSFDLPYDIQSVEQYINNKLVAKCIINHGKIKNKIGSFLKMKTEEDLIIFKNDSDYDVNIKIQEVEI